MDKSSPKLSNKKPPVPRKLKKSPVVDKYKLTFITVTALIVGLIFLYATTGNPKSRGSAPVAPSSPDMPEGWKKEIITAGDEKTYPNIGDTVTIHVGTLLDGTKFDSSRDRGRPFTTRIGVGQLIKGWDEAVPKMSLGEKATLTIAPEKAYGARGFPPKIPAQSTLVFEVTSASHTFKSDSLVRRLTVAPLSSQIELLKIDSA
ncbi:hypothetical protein HK102_011638 [Quaeritorhiza haematococci]|nr:hypothetical protein HK102_011638 [Quaeritorhiza haematococci]